jgi:hypothetical protein
LLFHEREKGAGGAAPEASADRSDFPAVVRPPLTLPSQGGTSTSLSWEDTKTQPLFLHMYTDGTSFICKVQCRAF